MLILLKYNWKNKSKLIYGMNILILGKNSIFYLTKNTLKLNDKNILSSN